MSQEEILKNVYTFLQILESARTRDVEEWDVQALKNALRWAEWCQMLSVKAAGKSYEQDLDTEVMKLNHLPWSLGCSTIDLKFLKEAKFQLTVSLLENPHLDPLLHSYFIDTSLQYDGQATFSKTCASLTTRKVTSVVAEDLLTDIRQGISGIPISDVPQEMYALHLLKFVEDAVERAQPSAKQRTKQLLNKKLRKMLETCESGRDLLLKCLHMKGDHFNGQTFILNFLKGHISTLCDGKRRCLFANMETRDLCVLARNCPECLSIICDWLKWEGSLMVPCLEDRKLNWKNTNSDGLKFVTLSEILRDMWVCDLKMASYIEERLLNDSGNGYSVWKSIQRQLHKNKRIN